MSRGLTPSRLVLMSGSLGFAVSLAALGPQLASVLPSRMLISCAIAGLVVGFTIWTVLDLQRASPDPHGIYRLALQAHSDWLSSLVGWVLLGGELTVAALLGRALGEQLGAWVGLGAGWTRPAFAAGVVLLMALVTLASRWQRPLQIVLLIGPLVGYVAALGIDHIVGVGVGVAPIAGVAARFTWGVTALALVGFWGLEAALVESEDLRRPRVNLPRVLVAAGILIPCSVGLVGFLMVPHGTEGAAWPFWSRWGAMATTGLLCLLMAGALWWVILVAVRQGLILARHGFLPAALTHLDRGGRAPIALLLAVAGVAALLAAAVPASALAAAAAFVWALAAVGVNVSAIIRYDRAEEPARKTVLPFFPLVPGLGIAGTLFLIAFLPVWAWLAAGIWAGAGVAVYALFGVRWRAQKREGITIFREDEEHPKRGFRVLVPVANPKTAKHLMELALTLVKPVDGDIVALQVVETPARVSIATGRRLARGQLEALKAASEAVEEQGVPVHVMTRVARTAHQGIVDTAVEEDCDLIILGWTQRAPVSSGSLGRIVDAVLRDAPCGVLVVSGQVPQRAQRILVPVTSGPHAEEALQLAGRLAQTFGASVKALHVVAPEASAEAESKARERVDECVDALKATCYADLDVVRSDDVVGAIVSEAERADMLVMGMSKESWLDRVLFGRVPEQVLTKTDTPLMLVRAPSNLARVWLHRLWDGFYSLFPNLEPEELVTLYRTLREGARGDVNYYVLIVLSAVIASLGLLADSAAVIIGAMLVAPLMTPILALSLGIVLGEPRMLSRGAESTIKGVGAAVVLSAFSALLFPVSQPTAEIIARTHPTLMDLGVALASGAAGAYALARKEVAAALPGVAIAAALMPPLCTVGIGLAQGSGSVMGGALLLFLTNLIAITLAGAFVFLLLGIRPKAQAAEREAWFRRGLTFSAAALVIISALLVGIMVRSERVSAEQRLLREVLASEVERLPSARLVSVDSARRSGGVWRIEATVQLAEPPDAQQAESVSRALAEVLHGPVQLRLRTVLVQEVESRHPK
ncbi:MAG: TIGR00341 family protein [Chloroflexi bacterium]|nr:TIGR00341 family protein [Chloroflexota bacterium]